MVSAGITPISAYLSTFTPSVFDAMQELYTQEPHIFRIRSVSILGTHYRALATVVLLQAWVWAISSSSDRTYRDLLLAVGCSTILVLASYDQWAPSVALAAFVATWMRLPNLPSSSPSMDELPTFDRFVKNLCDTSISTPTEPVVTNETLEKADDPCCIVCWSSDDAKKLPCAHLVCIDCLRNLRADYQYACPLCRPALFKRPDINILLAYKAVVSMWFADLAVRCLGVLLSMLRNEGCTWSFTGLILSFYSQLFVTHLGLKWAREAKTDWWRALLLAYLFGRPSKRNLWRPLCAALQVGWMLVQGLRYVQALDKKYFPRR